MTAHITPRGAAVVHLVQFEVVWSELTAADRQYFARGLTESSLTGLLAFPEPEISRA
jgi:hypothetical protein